MGKKSWFSAVKKAVGSSCLKKKKDKRSHKSKSYPKRSFHGNQMSLDLCLSQTQLPFADPPRQYPPSIEETMPQQPENEQQIEQVYSIDDPTDMAEDIADTASCACAEVRYSTSSPRFLGKSTEEIAAIKIQKAFHATSSRDYITPSPRFLGKSTEEIAAIRIQKAFRGYLARKAVKPLTAERRLKLLIQGQAAKRQTESTLRCLQTMARVQSQVRTRRMQMTQVNKTLQRQRHQKDKQEWDLSPRSKEQVEASLRRKKEAAERREKALAYSYSRQQTWRKSLKSANSKSTNPNGTYWGWSWSERWEAVRPWETEAASNTELVGDKGKHVSCQSPSMPTSKALSSVSGVGFKSASSKKSTDNGVKSLSSMRSKRSLSVCYENSSPATCSYKGPTKTIKTRSQPTHPSPSPLKLGKKGISNTGSRVGSANNRLLSMNSSASGGRRSLGPLRTNSNTRR